MRIVHQDTKKGIIELLPETLDDLWHLSHLIEPGNPPISQDNKAYTGHNRGTP